MTVTEKECPNAIYELPKLWRMQALHEGDHFEIAADDLAEALAASAQTDGREAGAERLLIELVDRIGSVTVDTKATDALALAAFLDVENRAYKFLRGVIATRADHAQENPSESGEPSRRPIIPTSKDQSHA